MADVPEPRPPRCLRHSVSMAGCGDCEEVRRWRIAAANTRLEAAKAERPCRCRQCTLNRETARRNRERRR